VYSGIDVLPGGHKQFQLSLCPWGCNWIVHDRAEEKTKLVFNSTIFEIDAPLLVGNLVVLVKLSSLYLNNNSLLFERDIL
jgi:hypothetical protein